MRLRGRDETCIVELQWACQQVLSALDQLRLLLERDILVVTLMDGHKYTLDSLNNLRMFSSNQKLQQSVLSYLASQMYSKEKQEELKKIFQLVDVKGDVKLERSDHVNGY